jgi:hypothetical protein
MTIEEFLIEQAKKQLDKTTDAVSDGAWFDSLILHLKSAVDESDLNANLKQGTHEVISTLESRKSKIIGLGANAFTLMIHQMASGRSKKAIETYIQSLGSAELIIKAMDQGTLGLIAAKKELDRLHDDALALVQEIAIQGAKHLLPFLLSLI